MFKSQKLNTFFFFFFLISFISICQTGKCEVKNNFLQHADSLFAQKKFTEAFKIYQSLSESGVASPAMYLKMAYIKEALDDIPGALFFLNKYYLLSRNKLALKKMETLAGQHGMTGYEYSDKEFLENLVLKYGTVISSVIALLLVFLFGLMVYQRFYQKKRSLKLQLSVLILASIVILNSNTRMDKRYGIVQANASMMMSSPSSGADVVDVVSQGNRFIINGGNDIWLKLEDVEQSGYIRKIDLLLLREKQPFLLWAIDRIKGIN